MSKPPLEPPWWFAPAVALAGLGAGLLMLAGATTVLSWILGW